MRFTPTPSPEPPARARAGSAISRGLFSLATGVVAALALSQVGPFDSGVEGPLAAGMVGSSVGLGLVTGLGAWLQRHRRRRHLPGLGALAGVRALLATLANRDGETAVHCARVARVADVIADQLGGLTPARRHDLRTACLLHDIGKLWVPLPILRKAGALDDDEWARMRAHAADGSHLARSALDGAGRASRIIHQHHERLDGRGYPEGIDGDQILLEARIVAVADALDAMVCDRPYRRGMPLAAAIAELRRASGEGPNGEHQFDPVVVEALAARLPVVERLYHRELSHPRPVEEYGPALS